MNKLPLVVTILFAAALAAPVHADPGQGRGNSDKGGPKNAGAGEGRGQGQGNQGQGNQGQGNQGQGNQGHGNQGGGNVVSNNPHPNIVVSQGDRSAIHGYYQPMYAAGNCPPGLAKKNNGCLPPGQAKKMWVIGQPLPMGVVYYPLPGVLIAQLTPAPSGYQYVRVANDILMMAVGTRLIAGAVADLSSM